MSNTALKFLLYAAILGFTIWAISEVIEIVAGYEDIGYYMTAVFHFIAGFSIWGLHLLQSKGRNVLSLVGTAMISLSYFCIVYFPIQVMNSGKSVSAFVEDTPIYKIPLFVFVIGHVIFGIAVLRTNYFPDWTGVVLIVTAVILTGIYTYEILSATAPTGVQRVLNVTDIALAAAIIYMCFFGLNRIATTANNGVSSRPA